MRTELLIIGAGPTGLGAALRCIELGFEDFMVIESAAAAGGLATSIVDENGFTWDLGAHVQFSHYAKFDETLDGAISPSDWLTHDRSSWLWTCGRFVPYPFQHNLHRLPRRVRWECVRGLLEAERATPSEPSCFRDWISARFGKGIAEQFLFPYNEKIWAWPLEDMSHHWVRERVAEVDLEKALESVCLQEDQTSWGPNAHFRYPRRGGTGGIWRSLAARLPTDHLRLGHRVMHVDAKGRTARTADGHSFQYRRLVNTMPLDALTQATGDSGLQELAARLAFSRTHLVGLGFEGCTPFQLGGKYWIYFPDSGFPFYRLTVFSNLSPENTPSPGKYWSVLAEVAESDARCVSPQNLQELIVAALRAARLLTEGQRPVACWRFLLPHGYPIPTLARDRVLADLLPALEERQIYSRGRFGAWKYEVSNQDHSFMQGVEIVERLLNGFPELTVHRPELVNGRYNPFPYQEWGVPQTACLDGEEDPVRPGWRMENRLAQ